jgi:hypothetical protein
MNYEAVGNNIVENGMEILMRHFDALELESFIYYLRNDNFDFTKWRQTQPWYTDRTLEEINNDAAEFATEYAKTHQMPPGIML